MYAKLLAKSLASIFKVVTPTSTDSDIKIRVAFGVDPTSSSEQDKGVAIYS